MSTRDSFMSLLPNSKYMILYSGSNLAIQNKPLQTLLEVLRGSFVISNTTHTCLVI